MKRVAVTVVVLALAAPGVARADAKAECIAALEEGQPARAAGRLTEAIARFAVCARDVCPRSIQKLCVEQGGEASALRPTIVLSATDASNNAVVDARVSADGVAVATVLDGKAIAIDPGLHTFRFEKPGMVTVERRVAVREGQRGQPIAVQLLSAAPAIAPVAAAPSPPAPPESTPGSFTTLRWAGLGVGAAGLAAMGVGGVFVAKTASDKSAAHCDASGACDAGPLSDARSAATVATVGFIAGGALLAGGAAIVIFAPKRETSTSPSAGVRLVPVVGARDTGILMSGSW